MKSKKLRILIILIVIAVLIMAIIILFSGKQQRRLVLEDNFAAGPMFYMHIKKPADHIQDILSTQFVGGLKEIDVVRILEDVGIPSHQLSDMKEKMQSVDLESIQKLIRILFSEEVGLALYAQDLPANPQMVSLETAASNLAIVTRLKGGMAFVDILIESLAKFSPDIDDTQFTYKRHTIHLLSDSEKTFKIGYTKIGSFLIFGYGDKAARMAIDTITQESVRSLAEDDRVTTAFSQTPPSVYLKGFIDAEQVLKQVYKQMLAEAAKGQDPKAAMMQANKMMLDQKGFNILTFTMGVSGKAQKLDAKLLYDETQLSADLKAFLRVVAPSFSAPLTFTPQRALVYRWSNGLDMKFIWNRMQLQLLNQVKKDGEQMSAGQVLELINEGIGFNIKEDLFPLIGDEYGAYVVEIQENTFYPIPRAVFFLKVTDKQKAAEFLLDQIESFHIVRVEKENYKGKEVFFARLPVLSDIVPGYAFVEGYLVAAINKADLFEAIDLSTQNKAGSLAAAEVITNTEHGLAYNGNGLIVLQIEKLSSQLYKVVDWWGRWVEGKEKTHNAAIKGGQMRLEKIASSMEENDKVIKEAQDKITDLEQWIAAVDEEALTKDLEKARSGYEQAEKFLDHAQERVDELKVEQQELLAVKESEKEKLSAAGEARLEEISKGVEKNMQRIEDLKQDADKAKAGQDEFEIQVANLEQAKGELAMIQGRKDQAESEKTADLEKQQELENVMAELEAEKFISPEKRERLMKQGMEPALRALSHWKWFAFKKMLRSGEMDFQCFWEVE